MTKARARRRGHLCPLALVGKPGGPLTISERFIVEMGEGGELLMMDPEGEVRRYRTKNQLLAAIKARGKKLVEGRPEAAHAATIEWRVLRSAPGELYAGPK